MSTGNCDYCTLPSPPHTHTHTHTHTEEEIEDDIFATFDFSTLYTLIPHSELKSRMKNLFTLVFKQQAKRKYGGFSHLAVSELGAEWVKANHAHKPNTSYHTASTLSSFLDTHTHTPRVVFICCLSFVNTHTHTHTHTHVPIMLPSFLPSFLPSC
jgi:hypothetical protein